MWSHPGFSRATNELRAFAATDRGFGITVARERRTTGSIDDLC
jgi:hypothetical protein